MFRSVLLAENFGYFGHNGVFKEIQCLVVGISALDGQAVSAMANVTVPIKLLVAVSTNKTDVDAGDLGNLEFISIMLGRDSKCNTWKA